MLMPNHHLTDGLDPEDHPDDMSRALADAKARPWLYRLADGVRADNQAVYDLLISEGRSGALVQRIARTLALDQEARDARTT